jgi:hypothetical protein
MNILIDFDGTIVAHAFPQIGGDIGAFPVLEKLIAKGHTLTLFTMRSGKELQEAVEYIYLNRIHLYGINKTPGQTTWTTSPKAYGQLIIDDISLGIPLMFDENTQRDCVDWRGVEALLIEKEIL